jgi:hypothetical protein
MKIGRPVNASNGVPHLQMRSVGSHRTSRKEKEEKTGNDEFPTCVSEYLYLDKL